MFKFGFSQSEENVSEPVKDTADQRIWQTCEELVPQADPLIKTLIDTVKVDVFATKNFNIKYLCSTEVMEVLSKTKSIKEISILKAEQNHSDLLPAVYEGGLKVWECTYDLLRFLDDNPINFENARILDLGCGTGIAGLFGLLAGATCWFQDYNADVIRYITIPNVLLNNNNKVDNCRFFYGDWESFACMSEKVEHEHMNKFDYILTSETIYNIEAYPKLHKVFETYLKKNGTMYPLIKYDKSITISQLVDPTLILFLAAKLFYFGVGGGLSLFKDYLDKREVFTYETCWEHSEGVKRAILKITFRHF